MTFHQAGVVMALTKLGFAVPSVSGVSGVQGMGAPGGAAANPGARDLKQLTTGIRAGVGDIVNAPKPASAPKPMPAGVSAVQRSAT